MKFCFAIELWYASSWLMNDAPPSLRILRSDEVDRLTGTHPSQRARLEGDGKFPMRVKITNKSVGWIEGEILAWIKGRMALRDEVAAYEDSLPPGARYRLRMQREREGEKPDPAKAGLSRR
jgi:prophage regulatory protein